MNQLFQEVDDIKCALVDNGQSTSDKMIASIIIIIIINGDQAESFGSQIRGGSLADLTFNQLKERMINIEDNINSFATRNHRSTRAYATEPEELTEQD
jgi:hypothetical protein